jgi:hypothetical protein
MSFPGFKYRGFGLNIRSEIGFPELFPADFEQEDILIRIKTIEDHWFESIDPDRGCQQVERDFFRLQVPCVGRYFVRQGMELQMESSPDSDPSAFRMYALTHAMSACLVQRGLTLLHASGILVKGSVVLFAGESGAGKSTMISKFNRRGYAIFSDDVCVMDDKSAEDGQMIVSASYPLIKLNPAGLTRDFPNADSWRLWPDSEKHGIGFHRTFEQGRYPLAAVFVLRAEPASTQTEIVPLHGVDAFRQIVDSIYRKRLICDIDQQVNVTRMLTRLADKTPVFSVRRTILPDDGESLADLLESYIRRRFLD